MSAMLSSFRPFSLSKMSREIRGTKPHCSDAPGVPLLLLVGWSFPEEVEAKEAPVASNPDGAEPLSLSFLFMGPYIVKVFPLPVWP